MLEQLKEIVLEVNRALPREGLVRMTSGNASQRDPESGLVAIKPSGVPFEELTRDDIVLVDLDGRVVEGHRSPSSDTLAHLAIYRGRPDIGGIVHTHSPFATAFALLGESVPVYLTAMADDFGEAIPVTEYAPVGTDAIGREVLRVLGNNSAVLLRAHGVITVGKDAPTALRKAVVLEETLKTIAIAKAIGRPVPLAPEVVAAAHRRFVEEYGQRPAGAQAWPYSQRGGPSA